MKDPPGHVEDSWCTDPETDASKSKEFVPETIKEHTSDQDSREELSFTDVIRGFFYGEERESTEDASKSDEEPDKIEAHRMVMSDKIEAHRSLMEISNDHSLLMESSNEIVHQNYYACEVKSEARMKKSMLKLANHTLDENEILKRYLSQGTETNNSAMLFLAGTLFSSNQYIFDYLIENGFFSPSSQKVVNSLASDFISQSRQLSNVLLKAERSSGAAIKNMVVSCVNDFVSTSNKLANVLEHDVAQKTAAVGSAKAIMLNNIFATRNQISDSLYTFFQRTVKVEKSAVSAMAFSDANASKNFGATVSFLADSKKFTKFLYSGTDTKRLTFDDKVQVVEIAENNTSQKRLTFDDKVQVVEISENNACQTHAKKNAIFHSEEQTITDASDMLSTASSFLHFINESSLSKMFEEDEQDIRDADVPESHLDAIFERMNLSVPKETVEADAASTVTMPDWGYSQVKLPKLSAKEKRKHMIIARSQARKEKKQKNKEKKKSRAKESNKDIWSKINGIGRKSKKSQEEILEGMAEV